MNFLTKFAFLSTHQLKLAPFLQTYIKLNSLKLANSSCKKALISRTVTIFYILKPTISCLPSTEASLSKPSPFYKSYAHPSSPQFSQLRLYLSKTSHPQPSHGKRPHLTINAPISHNKARPLLAKICQAQPSHGKRPHRTKHNNYLVIAVLSNTSNPIPLQLTQAHKLLALLNLLTI